MSLALAEAITSEHRVITSAGEQQVAAASSSSYSGDIVTIETYGHPKPLRLTPGHRVLTANGWSKSGDLRAMDWLAFPVPWDETPMSALADMVPAAPQSTAAGVDRLTGQRLPVTREALSGHLRDGLSYQAISELYGRKTRSSAYGWALHYGLTRSSHNVLTGNPTAFPDFWRVVGYWLAEGDLTAGRTGAEKSVVRFTFGHSEQYLADDVADVLGRYGLTVTSHMSERMRSISARCSSQQLARFLAAFGYGAYAKRLPEDIVRLPGDLARELVRGYWTGDGTLTGPHSAMNDGWARITSVSLPMLTGFYRLLPRLGVTGQIMKSGRLDRQRPIYEIRFPMCDAPWLGHSARQVRQHSVRIDGDRLLVKIKRIAVEQYQGPVCDLQTPAGDLAVNNFTVEAAA